MELRIQLNQSLQVIDVRGGKGRGALCFCCEGSEYLRYAATATHGLLKELVHGKSATAVQELMIGYVGAAIGVQLFASVKYRLNLDRQVNFRSFSNSFLFLFQVLTGVPYSWNPPSSQYLHIWALTSPEPAPSYPSPLFNPLPPCPPEPSCPLMR